MLLLTDKNTVHPVVEPNRGLVVYCIEDVNHLFTAGNYYVVVDWNKDHGYLLETNLNDPTWTGTTDELLKAFAY